MQAQARQVEQLVELAHAADDGDAAEVQAPDIGAPFTVGPILLLSTALESPGAEPNVQSDSAFR